MEISMGILTERVLAVEFVFIQDLFVVSDNLFQDIGIIVDGIGQSLHDISQIA